MGTPSDSDKYQAEVAAVFGDRVHTLLIEYRGQKFDDDAYYYLIRSIDGDRVIFKHLAKVMFEAAVNFGAGSKAVPHAAPFKGMGMEGWTLAAYAAQKSLLARKQIANFDWTTWDRRPSFDALPESVQNAITVTIEDNLETETKITRTLDAVMAQVRRVFRRLDFEPATVTRLGIYLSTSLTMREVSAAVLNLAKEGAILATGRGGSIILDKLEIVPDKWVDPPTHEVMGGFRHTRLPYEGKPIVFVMMPFEDKFWNWLDGKDGSENLRSLISNWTGAKCVTVDDDKTDAVIEDKIATHISEALFSVANISDLNPNVFYELGIAHALGKPVILIYDEEVHKKHAGSGADGPLFGSFLKSVFDVNHRRIIECTSKKDLIPQLEEAVRQVLKTLAR